MDYPPPGPARPTGWRGAEQRACRVDRGVGRGPLAFAPDGLRGCGCRWSSEPSRRRHRGRRVSRRNVALKCRASRAQGVSRAGSSVDAAGRAAGSRDRRPRGPEPRAGLGPGARNGPDRLRVARPRREARSAATDVPGRPEPAMETAGTRRVEEGPRAVAGDGPPERAGADAAPAGVPPGRGAGRGSPGRGAREAGEVPDLAPADHGQHPPDPRQRAEELEFRRWRTRRRSRCANAGAGRHDLAVRAEPRRRVAAVWREEGEHGVESHWRPAPPEHVAGTLKPEPGPWPRGPGSAS